MTMAQPGNPTLERGLVRTLKRRPVWFSFTGAITSVAFTPDGTHALSGSECHQGRDQYVRLWDVATGEEVAALEGHRGGVRSLAVSPDGAFAVSVGAGVVQGGAWVYDAAVRVWDLAARKEVRRFGADMFLTSAVAYTPDGRRVVTGSKERDRRACLRVWEVATGREVARVGEHPRGVDALRVLPDGSGVVTGSFGGFEERPPTLKRFDLASGHELPFNDDYRGSVVSVACTPDGAYLVSGGRETVLWELATGSEVRRFGEHPWVHAVAISPDGRWLATGNGTQEEPGAPREDCVVRIFDLHTGAELCALAGHRAQVRTVAWSPDGRHVISGDDYGEVRLWRAEP